MPITNAEPQPSHEESSHAVVIKGLSRHFRGHVALEDIDLNMPRGCVFGLVGLNGAGKTTLIRHMIGGLQPQVGTVEVLGMNPVSQPKQLLGRIGYMTEEDSLPTWMRVGEMIDFLRTIYPTWDDTYANELCDQFCISRTDRLKSLSKGGRARVALLGAIAHRPELLILDEPSSGLDPIARRDILEAVIRTINEDGRTVLFSSHILEEVDRVCDHISLLHNHRIVETTSAQHLQGQYVELVCHAKDSNSGPPVLPDSFGWQSDNDEWSGICQRGNEAVSLPNQWQLIDERPLTLGRWFEARTQPASPALENSHE